MNKSTIAILIILLHSMSATEKRTATFEVERSYHFLGLFKHTNFNLVLHTEAPVAKTVSATDYVWYFWSGYQEKFAKKDYTMKLITSLNGAEVSTHVADLAAAKVEDVSPLTMTNFDFPKECQVSEEVKSTIVSQGWKANEITLKLELTCTKAASVIEDLEADLKAKLKLKSLSKQSVSEIKSSVQLEDNEEIEEDQKFETAHSKVDSNPNLKSTQPLGGEEEEHDQTAIEPLIITKKSSELEKIIL